MLWIALWSSEAASERDTKLSRNEQIDLKAWLDVLCEEVDEFSYIEEFFNFQLSDLGSDIAYFRPNVFLERRYFSVGLVVHPTSKKIIVTDIGVV